MIPLSEFTIITQLAYVIKGVEFPSRRDEAVRGAQRGAGFLQLGSNPIRVTNASGDFSQSSFILCDDVGFGSS